MRVKKPDLEPSPEIARTRLWSSSLGVITGPEKNRRVGLTNAFLKARERAGHLANEIQRLLPDLTLHDGSHLDALWQMADIVAGEDFKITPTEGFVLGVCFLIHDLGMGIAAYPGGMEELQKTNVWRDAVAAELKNRLRRAPIEAEIAAASPAIQLKATRFALRELHADQAEKLPFVGWQDRDSDTIYHLIEDPELRDMYGRTIGRIARSHWWSAERLNSEFPSLLGAPVDCSSDWTVDPLKIACLLRVADAAHLDARRSPGFLRALRRPTGISKDHWIFQEFLQQPLLDRDRMVYTSGRSFTLSDAEAWWLCFDALQILDRELKQVDALLADTGRPRFAAKSVAGVDDPGRLRTMIPTTDWIPVDTSVRVSDVATLVRHFGGEELYGPNPAVPLRELIQNAADAVRARRIFEGRSSTWGEIVVELLEHGDHFLISVLDSGIGMSEKVLSGPLLDFGLSYWDSPLMREELPGLASKGFQSTGKYGIGFFSAFMWGDHVTVTTRRPHDALADSRTLEFTGGLASRPILRVATAEERLVDPGTRVTIHLTRRPDSLDGILCPPDSRGLLTLERLVEWLCPTLDVDVVAVDASGRRTRVVSASDWIDLNGEALLRRLEPPDGTGRDDKDPLLLALAANLRVLKDSTGTPIGRACIGEKWRNQKLVAQGVATVGGFRSVSLTGIEGVLLSESARAARDAAEPLVSEEMLSQWASEQATLVSDLPLDDDNKMDMAATIRRCGGNVADLPIAIAAEGYVTSAAIRELFRDINEVCVAPDISPRPHERKYERMIIPRHVLLTTTSYPAVLRKHTASFATDWPELPNLRRMFSAKEFHHRTLVGAIVEALADSWDTDVEALLSMMLSPEDMSQPERERNADVLHREIGCLDGEPIVVQAIIIRRPR